MADPKETINIENVVASTGIGQELDLQSVAMDLEGADYDPEQFPGLVYRTQEPKSAALIFRSGKIVCTGAKSTDDVHESLRIVFDKLRDLNIQVDEDPGNRRPEYRHLRGPRSHAQPERHRHRPRAGEHRVRARAVPRAGLPAGRPRRSGTAVRLGQAGHHRRQETRRRRRGRRQDRLATRSSRPARIKRRGGDFSLFRPGATSVAANAGLRTDSYRSRPLSSERIDVPQPGQTRSSGRSFVRRTRGIRTDSIPERMCSVS